MLPSGPPDAGLVIGGKYRILHVLGRGGLGIVYAAEQLELERMVALKFMSLDGKDAERRAERLRNEARMLGRLRSEHATRIYDVGALDPVTPFIVMEYLEGRDLARLLADDGPLASERAVDYVLQAADALAEAHALGIVHRDLKPANLFLSREPGELERVKVLDFGIAKHMGHQRALTNEGALLGSPRYMSPEQLDELGTVDRKSDIWSLGVTLFELLTAKLPFEGPSVPKLCAEIFNSATPPIAHFVSDVDPELDRVVQRCLQKERALRPDSMQELAALLMPFASDEGRRVAERVLRRPRAAPSEPVEDVGQADTLASTDCDAEAAAPPRAPRSNDAFITTCDPGTEPARARAWKRWAIAGALLGASALGGFWWLSSASQSPEQIAQPVAAARTAIHTAVATPPATGAVPGARTSEPARTSASAVPPPSVARTERARVQSTRAAPSVSSGTAPSATAPPTATGTATATVPTELLHERE